MSYNKYNDQAELQDTSVEVEITEIDKEKGLVTCISSDGEEGTFKVNFPCKIEFCKGGKATIKLNNYKQIVYCRSLIPKKTYPARPYSSGYRQTSQENPIGVKRVDKDFTEQEDGEGYYYDVIPQFLEKVTLETIKSTLKALKENNVWVFSTQMFRRDDFEVDKKDEKLAHYYYDLVIWTKIKKDGKRPHQENEN